MHKLTYVYVYISIYTFIYVYSEALALDPTNDRFAALMLSFRAMSYQKQREEVCGYIYMYEYKCIYAYTCVFIDIGVCVCL